MLFNYAAQIRGLTGNLTNHHPVLIKGSGQYMLVKLKSDSVISGRGFKANIDYKPRGLGTSSFCSTSNLCQIDEGHCGPTPTAFYRFVSADHECSGGLKCGSNNCSPQLELSHWVDCCYQPKWRRCQDSLDLEKGVLSSPYYPNYYEPFQECSWLISVPENYTVTLEFKSISVSFIFTRQYFKGLLLKIQFLFQILLHTHLKVYDGNSTWHYQLAHAYVQYDNIVAVASSGNYMSVTFSSEDYVGTGFYAKIYQNPAEDRDPQATFCTVTNPCKANEGHCYHDQQCQKGLLCGIRNCPLTLGYANDTNCCYEVCNDWLDMENGILISKNYRSKYPAHAKCSWTISAPQQNQTVKIQFLDFKVSSFA